MNKKQNIWVIVPAAGVGRRMGTDTPKQYLQLNEKTVIEHTLRVFDFHDAILEVVVVISKEDEYWPSLNINLSKPLHITDGGKERCDSVLSGLKSLEDKAEDNDWVLVHDAARPCLRNEDLTLLLDTLQKNEVGGILAVPVRDTMKRSINKNVIKETVERDNLWHALTPQMFRFGLLKSALESAVKDNKVITDEASAIELAGYQPVLVEGHADNIKITWPEDLALAAFFLRQAELEHQEENI
ncbi:MAG: 2-C-methyl-D-erythritol 4-phosphate cytidylyltransferase [Gammaproteobacteria bacterium]|nr:MAG: 2-C-methyl-D-erythritol 4-phosphate cytidylyltransferase [Gammaproteobacteria bacterium]